MHIEFISTGDEVLFGQIVDTNAAWFSQRFFEKGISIQRRHTVADDLAALIDIITETSLRADVVVVNGGLGPTSDDLSAEAAAKAMQVPLVLSQAWYDVMSDRYVKSGRVMSKSNEKQAWLPEGCKIIDNPVGTACGFSFQFNRARFYFTPGVPSEFKLMLKEQILPDIQTRFALSNTVALEKWQVFGLSEAALNETISQLNIPPTVTVGFRAALPIVEVKLLSAVQQDLVQAAAVIEAALAEFILFRGEGALSQHVQSLMLQKGLTLSLAESCTGGMIASELVANAGSSAFLDSSHVTYSNAAKQRLVNVSDKTLAEFGAVSMEVAVEMAEGARLNANVDMALAVSGIAGPGGGSAEKPVGTVAFALSTRTATYSQLVHIPRWGRQGVRTVSVCLALDMLRRELKGKDVFADYRTVERLSSAQQCIAE